MPKTSTYSQRLVKENSIPNEKIKIKIKEKK